MAQSPPRPLSDRPGYTVGHCFVLTQLIANQDIHALTNDESEALVHDSPPTFLRALGLTGPALAAVFGLAGSLTANAATDVEDGFEGSMSKWRSSGNSTIRPSNKEQLRGNYSAIVELHRYQDRNSYRTEIVPRINKFAYGQTYRLKFSMYIPNDWEADRYGDTLMQIHGVKDKGDQYSGPCLVLQTKSGNWEIVSRWDSRSISTKSSSGRSQVHKSSYARGRWTTWEFEIKWSYNSNGYIRVWKDGRQVASRNGPNCYNDRTGPYLKMGIYKPAWKQKPSQSWASDSRIQSREYFIDEVSVHKQ